MMERSEQKESFDNVKTSEIYSRINEKPLKDFRQGLGDLIRFAFVKVTVAAG